MNIHQKYMKHALMLAHQGLFTTDSNPRVGCVIVNNGELVGEGFHEARGKAHAEVHALRMAHEKTTGATVYVTLEPCSHQGLTPPCANILIKAGVTEVVICNQDPNPLVAGKGMRALESAKIIVRSGCLSEKGKALNPGFFKRMQTSRPFVRVKLAQSIDGRTAMANGESNWITGRKARADVQYWRARSHAILTGINTILMDDCRLTVRPDYFPRKYRDIPHHFNEFQPMRLVLDSQLRIPMDARFLKEGGRRIIMTASDIIKEKLEKVERLSKVGAEVVGIACDAMSRIDLNEVLDWLGEQQINELFVESGPFLAGALLQKNLVDQAIIYTAPVIMGSNARPLFGINIENMAERLHMDIASHKKLGNDWRIIANLK